MDRFLKLNGKKCTLFILYFTIVMETLIAQFKFPSNIRYLNDLVIVVLFYFIINTNFILRLKNKKAIILLNCMILLISVFYFSAILNFVPIRLVIWASRNTFRGFIYFFAVIIFLDGSSLNKVMNNLYVIQFINALLAAYQFFILHHEMDFVGGIFGFGNGAAVNIYNALMMSFVINGYLEKKIKIEKVIITILLSFFVAGIAEEKITYVFFVIILLSSIILAKQSSRKLGIILIGVLGICFGLEILAQLYPYMFKVMTNFNSILEYLSSTQDEGYRLPRIGAFSVITKLFFRNNKWQMLFGKGFGNCEYSEKSIFCSDFYKINGNWNYRWFTHQWTFLETGYIGFIVYVLFFVCILVCLLKFRKKSKERLYNSVGITMVICTICTIWYNATLKVDMSYIAFFSMAIGFVEWKNTKSVFNNRLNVFR